MCTGNCDPACPARGGRDKCPNVAVKNTGVKAKSVSAGYRGPRPLCASCACVVVGCPQAKRPRQDRNGPYCGQHGRDHAGEQRVKWLADAPPPLASPTDRGGDNSIESS